MGPLPLIPNAGPTDQISPIVGDLREFARLVLVDVQCRHWKGLTSRMPLVFFRLSAAHSHS